jgi:hypothetical protein
MGNRYLRKSLVVGAHAVLYHRKPHEDALRSWAKKLIQEQALQAALSRSRVLLVNSASRFQLEYLFLNVLGFPASKACRKPSRPADG